jgi:lipoprotein-anchoring transpeptidase ErfK/SrfK
MGKVTGRYARVYRKQRKGAAMKPSLFGALVVGVISLALCVEVEARRVVIDLSEQRAFLLEGNQVLLCSPIASGKQGWSTPTGRFRVRAKDLNYRSGSFGLIEDFSGRVVNANATPGTRVPRGDHYEPAPMPYFMEFAPMVGLHAGYLPGYPASHGCVRMPHDLAAAFFAQVSVGTPVTVVGSTQRLSHVRKALPVRPWPTARYASGW